MRNIHNVYYLPWVRRQFEKAKAARPELGNHIDDLRGEVGYYLAAHKAAGIRFDSKHLEIIYSDGVTVVLRRGATRESLIRSSRFSAMPKNWKSKGFPTFRGYMDHHQDCAHAARAGIPAGLSLQAHKGRRL